MSLEELLVPSRFMNKSSSKTKILEKENIWLLAIKRTRKNHYLENKYGEAPPKCLKSMIHLTMNLKKMRMRMNSPSSLTKSARCCEKKVGLNGESLQEECLGTRRTKRKVP